MAMPVQDLCFYFAGALGLGPPCAPACRLQTPTDPSADAPGHPPSNGRPIPACLLPSPPPHPASCTSVASLHIFPHAPLGTRANSCTPLSGSCHHRLQEPDPPVLRGAHPICGHGHLVLPRKPVLFSCALPGSNLKPHLPAQQPRISAGREAEFPPFVRTAVSYQKSNILQVGAPSGAMGG